MEALRTLIRRPLLWLLAGALVFLYLHLFIPPNVPLWIGGDQTVYLVNAGRMLHGEAIYRDFFQFTTPGTELLYLALFKLFGPREWIPNATLIALGLILMALVVALSKRVLSGWTAYLPAILVLTIPYRGTLNGTHHWFSAIAVLGALAVAAGGRTPGRLAFAGALCGLALFFTQAHGIAAAIGFVVFLLLDKRVSGCAGARLRSIASFLAGFLSSIVVTNVYFAAKAGLGQFWYSTVSFGLHYYRADREANSWSGLLDGWPALPPWRHLPIFASWALLFALLPVAYIAFAALYRRQSDITPPEAQGTLVLLSLVGFALLVFVAPAPDFFRLFPISPAAVIVFVWLVSTARRYRRAMLGCLWIFGLFLAFTEPWSNQRNWHAFLDFPAGKTAFLSKDEYDKYAWMLASSRPSEYFFDASRLPGLYFPLDLRDPARVCLLTTTDYTRPEQVDDVVSSLERRQVRLINWSSNLDHPENRGGVGDHLAPLRDYITSHYRPVKTFADGDEVWQRNP